MRPGSAFTGWVRETWPERPDLIAIDGKTPDQVRGGLSRRSHDRATGKAPLHPVSASATTGSLVLGQEAVAEKAGEVVAIPALFDKRAEGAGRATGRAGQRVILKNSSGCVPRLASAASAP